MDLKTLKLELLEQASRSRAASRTRRQKGLHATGNKAQHVVNGQCCISIVRNQHGGPCLDPQFGL